MRHNFKRITSHQSCDQLDRCAKTPLAFTSIFSSPRLPVDHLQTRPFGSVAVLLGLRASRLPLGQVSCLLLPAVPYADDVCAAHPLEAHLPIPATMLADTGQHVRAEGAASRLCVPGPISHLHLPSLHISSCLQLNAHLSFTSRAR